MDKPPASSVTQPREAVAVISAFVVALVMMAALGALATIHAMRGADIDRLERQLAASKASERTAWGKVYDMQDAQLESSCPTPLN